MGSTYDRGRDDTDITLERHERNWTSLQALSPAGAQAMRHQMDAQTLLGWAGVRCASLDRLPLAGAWPDLGALGNELAHARRGKLPLADVPRQNGLYVLTAMGSRGLTLSDICAEKVADAMNDHPWSGPADLAAALDPARFAWRSAYKTKAARA
jgi:tRNA 5-methylaminomethyl-2-thiouridine biosynthesis bifunctional protein